MPSFCFMIYYLGLNFKALKDAGITHLEPIDGWVLSAINHLIGSGYIKGNNYGDGYFYCFQKELIASQLELLNISLRQVARSLLRLEQIGIIKQEKELSEKKGKSLWELTELYFSLWAEPLPNMVGTLTKIGGGPLPKLEGSRAYNIYTNINTKEKENIPPTPLNSSGGQATLESVIDFSNNKLVTDNYSAAVTFEECWKHYPRKDGKEAARKAYLRQVNAKDVSNIILNSVRALEAAKNASLKEVRFIKYFSTFLNSKEYLDECYRNGIESYLNYLRGEIKTSNQNDFKSKSDINTNYL